MKAEALNTLEKEIERAIALIASLKEDKYNLERENESLRRQIEEKRRQAEEYKLALSAAAEHPSAAQPDFDSQAVKERLERLVGKLAALEDSWN
jgi:chromosome segregation ATPase